MQSKKDPFTTFSHKCWLRTPLLQILGWISAGTWDRKHRRCSLGNHSGEISFHKWDTCNPGPAGRDWISWTTYSTLVHHTACKHLFHWQWARSHTKTHRRISSVDLLTTPVHSGSWRSRHQQISYPKSSWTACYSCHIRWRPLHVPPACHCHLWRCVEHQEPLSGSLRRTWWTLTTESLLVQR